MRQGGTCTGGRRITDTLIKRLPLLASCNAILCACLQMLPSISAAEEAAALVAVTEQLTPRPRLSAQGSGPVAPRARLRELHGAWLSDAGFRAALSPLRAPAVDAGVSVDVTHRALQAWLGAALSAVDIPKFALFGLIPGDEFAPEAVLAAVWRMPHSHSHHGSGGPVCELLAKMEAAGFVKWERARRASQPLRRGSGGGDGGGGGGGGGRAVLHDVAHDFAVAAIGTRAVTALAPPGPARGRRGQPDSECDRFRVRRLGVRTFKFEFKFKLFMLSATRTPSVAPRRSSLRRLTLPMGALQASHWQSSTPASNCHRRIHGGSIRMRSVLTGGLLRLLQRRPAPPAVPEDGFEAVGEEVRRRGGQAERRLDL